VIKLSHLETPWLNLSGECELVIVRLRQVHASQRTENLSDDVIPRVPIEAQDHEVKRNALQQGETRSIDKLPVLKSFIEKQGEAEKNSRGNNTNT